MTFRQFRILVLLAVLGVAAGSNAWEQWRVRSWSGPVLVEIIPINGDRSEAVDEYVAGLTPDHFREIADFIQVQAGRYRLQTGPAAAIRLAPQAFELPPARPAERGAWDNMLWSLKLRWWAYRQAPSVLPEFGTVRLFVVYYTGEKGVALEHSLGLRKGLFGIVHAFAAEKQGRQNNVVIAHELLHTLGASDKYAPGGQPLFPDGYGDAEQVPRHPQEFAEIMAGRRAITGERAETPPSLEKCLIGPKTAIEINWL